MENKELCNRTSRKRAVDNPELNQFQRVEILLDLYAKCEASKKFLLAKGVTQEHIDEMLESDFYKEKLRSWLKRYSKSCNVDLTKI